MSDPRPTAVEVETPKKGKKRNLIGTPFRRVDGRAKVTGQTKFADDLSMPRMLSCKLLRSDVAHANIKSIDMSTAEAMDGVVGFLMGEEMPESFGILPVPQDEHALCPDRARYVGDPIVAVAAATEDAAHEAALEVEIDYESLTTIASVEEALATDEPRIHDYGTRGNVHKAVSLHLELEVSTHSHAKDVRMHRLADEIDRAGVEPSGLVLARLPCGEEDHRHTARASVRAQLHAERKTIRVRKADVE